MGNHSRSESRISLVVILVFGVFSAACQTAMSLEEAKRVAAEFRGNSQLPPQRTIKDIVDWVELTVSWEVDWALPTTTDRDTLAKFYFRRGLYAQVVGDIARERADLAAAVEHARIDGVPPLHQVLLEAALAERRAGDFTRFMDYIRRAIAASPTVASQVTYMSILAMSYAAYGDIPAAVATLTETTRLWYAPRHLDRSRLIGSSAESGEAQAALTEALAVLLDASGKYAEAEALYRDAEALCETRPSDFARRPVFDFMSEDKCVRRVILHSGLVTTLIRQGRLVEAEREARRIFSVLPSLSLRVAAVRSLSEVLLEQGRYRESEVLARAAIDMSSRFRAAPGSLELNLARAQLAMALEARGAYREALAEHDAIRSSVRGDAQLKERLVARALAGGHFLKSYAVVLLKMGQVDRALEILGPEFERSKRLVGEAHLNSGEIRGYLAQAYAAKGDAARALREFRAAVPLLLTGVNSLEANATGPRAADLRLVGILNAYIGFLADIKGTELEREAGLDAVAEAFRLSDVARGRGVQRALNASAVRAAAQSRELADLIRAQQDVTRQVSALSIVVGAYAAGSPGAADLRTRIDTLQRAVETLTAQIKVEFPAYAELLAPKLPTLEEVRAALGPDDALIAILFADDRSFVWAVSPARPVAFAAVAVGTHEIEQTVAALRKSLDPGAKTLGDIPALDLAGAHRLYSALLEPVKSGWHQARNLVVVTNGPLGQLPIAILPTRPVTLMPESGLLFSNYRHVPWLGRSHAVTMLPSVASITTLRALPPGDPNRRPFAGFGDPYFSREQASLADRESTTSAGREQAASSESYLSGPTASIALATPEAPVVFRNSPQAFDPSNLASLPRLPETAEEVRSLARAMNADTIQDVFLGARANEKIVTTLDLANYRVLAFATHGLVPGDLEGLMQPALALSAPEVTGVEGDGLLTMDEILALKLDADWVVLSACNTASGHGAGSDAVSGLGRAFFYAGARALLVSNWPVETTSARALTTDLFRRQRGGSAVTRSQALQETMNWLIDHGEFLDAESGKAVFSYAHPIFWAPFTLIGDGGAMSSMR